ELLAKRACIDVVGERALGPGAAARRQVAGELVKASLDRRLRQIFDQLPGSSLVARGAKQHEARAAGNRRAQPVGTGKRRRHPARLQILRQTALEFTDVPRARDIEREVTAAEFVPYVGHIRGRRRWRETAAKHFGIERERTREA